jgi:hypothetical protein
MAQAKYLVGSFSGPDSCYMPANVSLGKIPRLPAHD